MKKRILSFLLVFAILLTLPLPARAGAEKSKIDAEVFKQDGEYYDVLVEFYGQAKKADPKLPKVERRAQTISNLKECAKNSQGRVLDLIEKSDEVRSYEPFYIINAIQIEAKKAFIEELTALKEVKKIYSNGTNFEVHDFEKTRTKSPAGWNLETTNVRETWETFHSQGEGVVIGFIDSGVNLEHEALKESWRGHLDSELLDKKGNWYDLVDETTLFPIDEFGHGTATAGVALGRSIDQPLGVAPGAQWIAVRAFSGENAVNEHILRAAQWMLEPDGDPAKAPDIINNSWGGKSSSTPWFNDMLQAWIEADIFPVFAAGNSKKGTVAGLASIDNPASLKDAFAVGAVGSNLRVSPYSKKGPSSFDPKMIKPEVVAPGAGILTAKSTGGYEYWSGTSIAAPHISGVAALLLSINQDLSPKDLRTILIQSTRELTDNIYTESPNMAYGYGMVDVLKAAELAKEYKQGDGSSLLRIAGANRYETSLKIAEELFEEAETVYIANGHQFTDGLTMGSLTKSQPGPLLLIGKTIDQATLSLMNKLQAQKVVIIGGENSVNASVEKLLKERFAKVERVSGSNRYATAASIAEQVQDKEEVFLVNSRIDADAISIAGIAAKNGQAVLLSPVEKLPEETLTFLKTNQVEKVTLIGGESQLSQGIMSELKVLGIKADRIAGENRYATGALINQNYQLDAEEVYFANGVNTADAIAISPVIAQGGKAIQITAPNKLTSDIISYLDRIKVKRFYLLGGSNSLNQQLEYDLLKRLP